MFKLNILYGNLVDKYNVKYLETSPNIIDRNVSFSIFVDDLEPLNVRIDFVLGQVDWKFVSAGTIHHLSHLVL